jgi:subtilisin family serine protease
MRTFRLPGWIWIICVTEFLISYKMFASANKQQENYAPHNRHYVPGEVIVKYKQIPLNAQAVESMMNGIMDRPVAKVDKVFFQKNKISRVGATELDKIYKMTVAKETDIEWLCQRLMRSGQVEYAEPNYLFPVEAVPNDSLYSQQWHLPQIHAPEAWDIDKGDSSVIIAIVDTGVDWDHPDLAAGIWHNERETLDGIDNDGNGYTDDIRGWDFVDVTDYLPAYQPYPGEDGAQPDNNPMDFDGHGSFVAGLAGATTNNHRGISSVTWGCKIMPLRAGYKSLSGGLIDLESAAQAIVYAADNGASVINLSTSGDAHTVVEAARYAFEKGAVFTNSAGNYPQTENVPDLLEMEPYVLVVTSVDDKDVKSSFSHYYEQIDVSAPGSSITSTYFDNRYTSGSGTSFAAPIAAGLAGLIKSHNPGLSAFEIINRIIGTADNIDALNPGYTGQLGSGRINAYRALTETVNPKPRIALRSFRLDDSSLGNGNGYLDPGEEVKLFVSLENDWGKAENVTASITVDNWAVSAITSQIDYGAIEGLEAYPQNFGENSSNPFVLSVDENALPQIAPVSLAVSDRSGNSWKFALSLPINPAILLVDDDDGSNNVESYYTEALDSLGLSYEIWEYQKLGAPVGVLNKFSTVVWSCEWAFPSLDSLDRAIIQEYLDQGGNLFLSGQDIGWDLCDDTGDGNEFMSSDGASKLFYQQYLHADYLNDASAYSQLTGMSGDPIGDGLEFAFFQPGRSSDDQYPSEIAPINGAVSIFDYPNSRSGAVRFAGDYRTVYFSFGGYEAVTSEAVRMEIMPRVLNWLNDLQVVHQPLQDTEDTQHDYPVLVSAIAGSSPIASLKLLWESDGSLPYKSVDMVSQGGGNYSAAIPAQPGGQISYTIYARLENGYSAPLKYYHFKVGQDDKPPALEPILAPNATMSKGNIPVGVRATDDSGIDSAAVYVHYHSSRIAGNSLLMSANGADNYEASMSGPFAYGDSVFYTFSASDQSLAHNRAATAMDTLVIGREDFETDMSNWISDPQDSWGLDETRKHAGMNSANDSPYSELEPGRMVILKLKHGLDLSSADDAELSFWTAYSLRSKKDFGFVEISPDNGQTWNAIGAEITGINLLWHNVSISLSDYVAAEDSIRIRFRLTTDADINGFYEGWYLDDIQIKEDSQVDVEHPKDANVIPQQFELGLNYPNPFNPSTSISYALPEAASVCLQIFNSLGQLIKTLVDEKQMPGLYQKSWDGLDAEGAAVSAGIYFTRLQAGEFIAVRKMALVK